jgi:hypothetical protein
MPALLPDGSLSRMSVSPVITGLAGAVSSGPAATPEVLPAADAAGADGVDSSAADSSAAGGAADTGTADSGTADSGTADSTPEEARW